MQQTDLPRAEQIIVNRQLSLEEASAIIWGHCKICLHPEAQIRCSAAHQRLARAIAEKRLVYGLTTGFGPLANRLVSQRDGVKLQQNLVFHLATGVGTHLDWASARAMVLARLMSILQGASGASAQAINALIAVLNSDLSPCVPRKGTVGASGDLTPLAHMVLCLQGRGGFRDQSGSALEGSVGLQKLEIAPLDLSQRDGLALVNGTSAMTGIAVLNGVWGQRAIAWSIALTAALAETLAGRIEAWHPAFSELRPHPGQTRTAQQLLARVAGSARVIEMPLAERKLKSDCTLHEDRAGQDAYTLRCAPQVIGAAQDTLDWHNRVVEIELSSATDNPIFPESDVNAPTVLHGGNFMGQHIGLTSDAFANAMCVLAGLAERQIARVTDESLNNGLPAFLHEGPAGLNSGFMGAQVTATALLAEMRTTGAASVQSISTNGANQDVVSMGTIAARHAQGKLESLAQIQAILALCVAQAIDLRSDDQSNLTFSPASLRLRDFIRGVSPRLAGDRPLGQDVEALAAALTTHVPP